MRVAVLALAGHLFLSAFATGRAASIIDHPQFKQAVQAWQAGQLDDAEELWKSLLSDYPGRLSILNNLAVIAAARGDLKTAVELLNSALSTHQSIRSVYENLSTIYSHLASEPYKRALALELDEREGLRLNLIDKDQDLRREQQASTITNVARILSAAAVDEPFIEEPLSPQTLDDSSSHRGIVAMLEAWTDAWTRQDVASYVASYVDDYSPRGLSHKQWHERRAARINAPQFIEVSYSNLKIQELDRREGLLSLTFLQSYRSNLLRSAVKKRIIAKKILGVWKIVDEGII